jgi:hypothetical protein
MRFTGDLLLTAGAGIPATLDGETGQFSSGSEPDSTNGGIGERAAGTHAAAAVDAIRPKIAGGAVR